MTGKIFISHSTQDKKIADKIIEYLESEEFTCWVAPRDISPGMDWAESIIDGIDSASLMILIVSNWSNKSPQVRREVERAVSKGVTIIPLITEKIELSKWMQYYVSAHQWIDASSVPVKDVFHTLEDSIQAVFAKKTSDGLATEDLSEKDFERTSIEIFDLEPSEEKDERISQADDSKSDTSEDKYKRRYRVIRNSLIWFFIGCVSLSITLGDFNPNIGDLEALLPAYLLYGLSYGLTGFVLSFLRDREYRKRFIYSLISICFLIAFVLILIHGFTGFLYDSITGFLILSPFLLVVGLILAGLFTLLEKWMRH